MRSRISDNTDQDPSVRTRSLRIGPWKIELLPSAPYEVCYTPEQSVIGYSFDSQTGTHCFASDKRTDFHAIPNGLAWIPAGCEVYSQSTGGEYLKITCLSETRSVNGDENPFSNFVDQAAINSAFALRRALLSGRPIDHLACEEWIRAMESATFGAFGESYNFDQTPAWMNVNRFKQVDELIHVRLDTQLSVGGLARELGISAGFFSREFKRAIGRSPHQYIVDKRLASARLKLHQSKNDLSTIALDCGFSSHSHLTAQFKARYGITPAQMRQT